VAPGPAAPGPAAQGAGYIPQPPEKPIISAAYKAPAADIAALERAEPEQKAARPAIHALPPHLRGGVEPPKRTSLFSRVFGGGTPPAPPAEPAQPARATHREPVMTQAPRQQEPDLHVQEPARAAVRQSQVDEIALEIPAFLRRTQ
jgi:cell division protein FtsZ